MKKFSVILVAYKNIPERVEAKVKERMMRFIDSPSDIVQANIYGAFPRGGFDKNSREAIYFEWYEKTILKHLEQGYKLVLMEVPYTEGHNRYESLKELDDIFGDDLLVIEHDDI